MSQKGQDLFKEVNFMPVMLSLSDVDNFTASDVGITVVVGMLIVFAVLAIIFVCLTIM